jgi:Ca2+-transporting ATPase
VADGANELTAIKRLTALHILLSQFKSFMVWILIGAGILAGVFGEGIDAITIFAIVVLNTVIGFYQEYKAETSISSLKRMTAPKATVWRGGVVAVIPAVQVVVGDVLMLAAGDLVAADARLLTCSSLTCNEAVLTGESRVRAKQSAVLPAGIVPLAERTNLVFMGTSVANGSGRALVVAIAMQTELGRIAGLMSATGQEPTTPLQRKLDVFGRFLIWAALGIVAILFALGWWRGMPFLDLAMTSISLAVAAVPEGLPMVVTVALSLGVMRMVRRRALVRKLSAVETLGSTSVICTDKTGTLTVGEMTVRALWVADQLFAVSGEGYGPGGAITVNGKPVSTVQQQVLHQLAINLVGCNQAHLQQDGERWTTIGDPTEGALLAAGIKAGGNRQQIDQEMPTVREVPFDSERKRSAAVRRLPAGTLRALVNGAPGLLLERCTSWVTSDGIKPLTTADREHILGQTTTMASQALRVLGSAYRDLTERSADGLSADAIERDLIFVGLSGMYDPPRPECKAAIALCHTAGIRVVMITGDHPRTAAAIAHELGIVAGPRVLSGSDLDLLAEKDLRRVVAETSIYARVTAEHKLRIVRALQANGAVVAMTGDGVNDAPAIRGADIGIAMGRSGTEVTKQAADVIITDDNFATIVDAVREGRGIYGNIRKTLQYLLAGNTGELLLMTTCVVAGLPSPLLPIHLLWINLVTDGLPAFCLAADPTDPDVMKRGPRPRSERIADRHFLRSMLITGCLTAGVACAVYATVLQNGTVEEARGAAFAVMVFGEILRAFGARSDTKPIWRIALGTNISLLIVVALTIGFQVLSQHSAMIGGFLKTPVMPYADFALLLALGFVPLVVLELVKLVRISRHQRKTTP